MRKLFDRLIYGLGILTFSLLVLVSIFAVYGSYLRFSLRPSAKSYANDCIRAVVTTWSEDEFIRRSSPELKSDTTTGQLDHIFEQLKKMGSLQGCGVPDGDVGVKISLKNGAVITATYLVNATFQNGPANITIKIIRHDGVWQILGFHVDPPTTAVTK